MTELLDRLKDKALYQTQSFIKGAWVAGKPWIEVTSPTNRAVLAQMTDVGAKAPRTPLTPPPRPSRRGRTRRSSNAPSW